MNQPLPRHPHLMPLSERKFIYNYPDEPPFQKLQDFLGIPIPSYALHEESHNRLRTYYVRSWWKTTSILDNSLCYYLVFSMEQMRFVPVPWDKFDRIPALYYGPFKWDESMQVGAMANDLFARLDRSDIIDWLTINVIAIDKVPRPGY